MPPAPRPLPSVSVIVPVRDGGAAVDDLVAALEAQTLARERFEVLIADDGSTDGATDGISTEDGRLRVLPLPMDGVPDHTGRPLADRLGAGLKRWSSVP